MAKQQTFSDKLNKKVADTRTTIKIIKGFSSDIGSTRFIEKVIKIDDVGQIAKLDIN